MVTDMVGSLGLGLAGIHAIARLPVFIGGRMKGGAASKKRMARMAADARDTLWLGMSRMGDRGQGCLLPILSCGTSGQVHCGLAAG